MEEREITARLEKLYEAIEIADKQIEKTGVFNKKCKNGCHFCCLDKLEVFSVEAIHIQSQFGDFLKNEQPHPKGKCAMLSESGSCRIYPARPYVCRTQGMPLRTLIRKGKKVSELRDICEFNEPATRLTSLSEKHFLTTNSFEDFLATLQIYYDKGDLERVKLRDLFSKN